MKKRLKSAIVAHLEARRLLCGDHIGIAESAISVDSPGAIAAMSVGPESVDVLAVPAYSSRPGAPRSLYLDFNGHPSIDQWGPSFLWWGGTDVPAIPAYDTDGNNDAWTDAELTGIETIWKFVSEKFSIFDLNITTVRPDLSGDNGSVVIGGSTVWMGGATGVAYRNTFNGNSNVCFSAAYGTTTPRDTQAIARTAAHEAGHMLGLYHQSTSAREYAPGYIMGSGGQWASSSIAGTFASSRDGDDIDSHGNQDDLAVIVRPGYILNLAVPHQNRFGYAADDHANNLGASTSIPISTYFGVRSGSAQGVLTTSDIDFFQVSHTGGSFRVELLAAEYGAMLDPLMRIYNSSGAIVATLNGNTAPDGRGEVFDAASLAAGTYRISVVADDGAYGNIGQYTLNFAGTTANTPPNDSLNSATLLGTFGETSNTSVARGFGGSASITDSLIATDIVDNFRLRLPQNARSLTVQLSGMTVASRVELIRDIDNDRIVDPGETIYPGASGTGAQLYIHNWVNGGEMYYIRVSKTGSGNTNYTLRINADVARDAVVAGTPVGFDPQPLRGQRSIYDAISTFAFDTTDTYRVTAERDGRFTFRLEQLTNNLSLHVGIDTNANGLLDAAEFLASSTNAGTSGELIPEFAMTAGQTVLVRVTGVSSGISSNYRLDANADYAFGSNLAGNLSGARSLSGLGASSLIEYLSNDIDVYDTFQITGLGTYFATVTMLDSFSFSHFVELIRDIDNDGVVDANEIIDSGYGEVSGTVNSATAKNYIRVSSTYAGGEFPSIGNYRLSFRPPGQVTGSSFAAPTVLNATATPSIAGGFVGYDPEDASITDLSDYYRVTVASRTRLDLSVNSPLMGVQVLIPGATEAASKRIAGAAMYEGVDGAISVNLDPGTYLVRTYLFVPELQEEPSSALYQLTFSTAAVTDTAAPVVVATAFKYDRSPTGLEFTFDQNLAVPADYTDIEIIDLDDQSLLYEANGDQVYYDADDRTMNFGIDNTEDLTGILPDGNYRATLAAGSVRDESGNPNASAVSFDFHVLAGDVNRDRRVNFADLLRLAQNYGKTDAVFSDGDVNYDTVVNFADLLLIAQRYNFVLTATSPITSPPRGVFSERPVGMGDVLG